MNAAGRVRSKRTMSEKSEWDSVKGQWREDISKGQESAKRAKNMRRKVNWGNVKG